MVVKICCLNSFFKKAFNYYNFMKIKKEVYFYFLNSQQQKVATLHFYPF